MITNSRLDHIDVHIIHSLMYTYMNDFLKSKDQLDWSLMTMKYLRDIIINESRK